MPVPIAIAGMHRSGTSMITRALHDAGLHLIGTGAEDLVDAAEDNPEGFWENKAIVACNDELLEATGGAWDDPPDLPPQAADDPRVAHVAEAATAALAALGEHERWGFKDPRTCLTAGYWLDLEPRLRFVICLRHPLEVALSLKRRNQTSYSLGLALWERYYATLLDVVPPERRLVTHYDAYFLDPEAETRRLCDFAELDPAPPRVRSDLRHHEIVVSLGDAGVSAGLCALYAELCREAGAPLAPEPPADEGRVRRLILDGAVAQRHAEQRQAAIERLKEREEQFRAEHAATEDDLRRRIRDLEQQRGSTQATIAAIDERTRTTASRLEVAISAVEASPFRKAARRSAGRAFRLGRRTVVRPARRAFGRGKRTVAPAARSAAHELPPPTQQTLRRGRRLLRRAAKEPVPTARVVERRLVAGAGTAAHRLPPPAQQTLRRGRRLLRRAAQEPVPTAKDVARRLPPPAQRALRRARPVVIRLRGSRSLRKRRRPGAPRAAPTPKGPALRQWKESYQAMVAAAVPVGEPWLVISPGSPKEVREVGSREAEPFPDTRGGRPFADDLAHIARLEARRAGGCRYLVLPEGSRPWFRQQAELRDHVARTYRTLVEAAGAGAVFDLSAAAEAGTRTLRGEVSQLSPELPRPPAVLDWTTLDLAGELPGLSTFQPPAGDRLLYLDRSVEVVVVDGSHDLDDARRVASVALITVAVGASGVEVADVEHRSVRPPASTLRVLVWSSDPEGDDAWRTHLATRAEASGADLEVAEIGADGRPTLDDHDVVVVVEPHVVPLPGAIEAAAALAAGTPGAAVAGKVLRADGRLESAGGTVFSDRSVGLVAGSSPDVRAPWHDYVRAVCWAPGLVAASSSLWASAPGPRGLTGRPFLREWCAEVWANGSSVVYQPTVTAVRVSGDGGEPSVPLGSSAWQRVLDLRPARPRELGDGAWRYLLAHDDVEACRG